MFSNCRHFLSLVEPSVSFRHFLSSSLSSDISFPGNSLPSPNPTHYIPTQTLHPPHNYSATTTTWYILGVFFDTTWYFPGCSSVGLFWWLLYWWDECAAMTRMMEIGEALLVRRQCALCTSFRHCFIPLSWIFSTFFLDTIFSVTIM